MITKQQLAALASIEAKPVVSIYVPTHEKAREVRQDPIRLRKALSAATQELVDAGYRRAEAEELLDGVRRLVEDEFFWRHQSQGLAVFAGPGLFQHHKLPITVPELHVIGPRPHVKPLLPLLADDGTFYCLTAKASDMRLYAGSRFALTEMDIDLPRGVAEISAESEYENTQHTAPAGRPHTGNAVGMPAAHNFGETPEDVRKTQLIEYLRRVHNALEDNLGGVQQPIVLVAQPEVEGHLKALAKNIEFHDDVVQIDPASLDQQALHERAYEVVRPLFARARETALDRFNALKGSGDSKAGLQLEAIVGGARFGRVDTLFVAGDETLWGRHEAGSDRVQVDPARSPDNEDLLDYAAVQTLLQGGAVHVLPRSEMPVDAPLAAIFRY